MPSSEQENSAARAALNTASGGSGLTAATGKPTSSAPFRFHTPRILIDWRALHSLDVCSIVRDTDLDALERVLDLVAFGDIEAEDARNLTPLNFIKLFRVAQLTVDYLLHVQDRLATDSCAAKGEVARLQQQVQVLQLKVKEQREELAGSRKESRHLKKSLRTFEALALARQQAPPPLPPPPPEVRVVERVVEVPDPAAARKVEKLEAELERAAQERLELQHNNAKLADALADAAARQTNTEASVARAVEAARQEERKAAEGRLRAALEEEHRKHSKAKLSVVVNGDDSPDLRSKLAAAQRRERDAERRAEVAEMEAAAATAAAGKAAAGPTAEAHRLLAQLESAQAEADMLRSRLAQRERERERSPCRQGGQAASGLAAELEDVDDARVHQLESQVEAQQAKLAAAEVAQSKLAARCQELERQLQQAKQQQQQSSGGSNSRGGMAVAAEVAERAAQAEVLEREVARLREEKAALKEDCRRLRQQAAQDAAEIEHLRQRLQQGALPSSSSSKAPMGRSSSPGKAVASPGNTTASVESKAPREEQQQPGQEPAPGKGGIGSPIEEPAAAAASSAPELAEHAAAASPKRRPGSSPGSTRSRRWAGSPRAPSASPKAACSTPTRQGQAGSSHSPQLSAADREQFRREMQHTLRSADRPGVVSRFPHSLASFLTLRSDLETELEAELAAELESFGLDPAAQHLTDRQFAQAMAELERRRAQARQAMSPEDLRRAEYMRTTASWHLLRMAELASGERQASPVRRQLVTQAPSGLKPIRTVSRDDELSPRHSQRGFVEQVLEHVGDENAVYSPLQRGASVLSERGYLSGDVTPRSGASGGLWVVDGGGMPRSPWAVTHDRVFNAALELESSRSPLRHAVSSSPARTPSPLASASAGASPTRQPRAARSVQFVDRSAPGQYSEQHAGGTAAAAAAVSPVAAQRMGRRSAVPAGASRGSMCSVEDEIVPAESAGAGSGMKTLRDSRDLDTGDAAAAAVRPVPKHDMCQRSRWGG